ncbi:rhomboid family intramembrane serine protease [Lactobacillus psittaci]|uniref:Peptidase S54 rhomboid domain-containing protein n=1 Tax=Lactobacillus psittaci DSM 15354 TaxID=1122152 RepID=A0A0R1S2U3_9LACO|nr:rhomboid family intramembrane serine protease [Lactobacillus psittaci]KRL63407.1 hypothetical protein FC23_GL000647 [Lactobacillus psittaci DSM 15354]
MQRRTDWKSIYVTAGILVALLVMFIIETLLGGSEDSAVLFKLGASYNPAIAIGQYWRLFTAQFLHIGVLHLASNAVMIFYLGQLLEEVMGHGRYLALYLLSGVGGNLLSFALGSDFSLSAGASTSLFGLLGALLAFYLVNMNNQIIAYLGRQAIFLAVINLAFDLASPSIDILGHVGGLISGFLLAGLLGSKFIGNYPKQARVVFAAVLIVYTVWTVRMGLVITG